MSLPLRLLCGLALLHVAFPGRCQEATRRGSGLSLDLEACVNGGCILASAQDGDSVHLAPGDAVPVRIRLHLDCAEFVGILGIARTARVVLVRKETYTLQCPRIPQDAYCEFRFWEGDRRSEEDLSAAYFPQPAATSWTDAPGAVDEAEITVEADWSLEPGEHALVAALPQELVDQYPCEEVRNHPWIESPRLRIVITEPDVVRWNDALRALRAIASTGDEDRTRDAFDALAESARRATPGLLPSPELVAQARRVACLEAGDRFCTSEEDLAWLQSVHEARALAAEADDAMLVVEPVAEDATAAWDEEEVAVTIGEDMGVVIVAEASEVAVEAPASMSPLPTELAVLAFLDVLRAESLDDLDLPSPGLP